MSRITEPNFASTQVVAEDFVWPEFNTSPSYRKFIERLRLARSERGLSIADMSDEVGLTFRLAHEFENITAPLPFEWLEVWCQTVGVPFDDYLSIYWADQREWDERQAELDQNAPCITKPGEADASETPAPTSVKRGARFLNLLRAAFARITMFFYPLFSTA